MLGKQSVQFMFFVYRRIKTIVFLCGSVLLGMVHGMEEYDRVRERERKQKKKRIKLYHLRNI